MIKANATSTNVVKCKKTWDIMYNVAQNKCLVSSVSKLMTYLTQE